MARFDTRRLPACCPSVTCCQWSGDKSGNERKTKKKTKGNRRSFKTFSWRLKHILLSCFYWILLSWTVSQESSVCTGGVVRKWKENMIPWKKILLSDADLPITYYTFSRNIKNPFWRFGLSVEQVIKSVKEDLEYLPDLDQSGLLPFPCQTLSSISPLCPTGLIYALVCSPRFHISDAGRDKTLRKIPGLPLQYRWFSVLTVSWPSAPIQTSINISAKVFLAKLDLTQ